MGEEESDRSSRRASSSRIERRQQESLVLLGHVTCHHARGVSRARVTRDPFLAAARTDEELDRPRVRFVTITEREDLKRRALL